MNWRLKWKLQRISAKADPQPAFVRALEKRLKAEIGHPIWWIQWGRVGASIISATLVLGTTATGAYAYTSDEVVPDHPLYSVRQSIEQVEKKLAVTDEAKTKIELKQLKRRLQEAQKLRELRRPLQAARLQQISDNIQNVIKKMESVTGKNQEQLKRQAMQLEQEHLQLLERTEGKSQNQEERVKVKELIQEERSFLRERMQELRLQKKGRLHETVKSSARP